MVKKGVPERGDVYLVNPNPVKGKELENEHRFVVISPYEINKFGVSMAVAVVTVGAGARLGGLTVPIQGHQTSGVAVCNQVRTFDLRERGAKYLERLDEALISEIIRKVVSIIDPEEE